MGSEMCIRDSTHTDGADITCVYVPVVLDAIARLFPQNIHAFAIDVSHTPVPDVIRLGSRRKITVAASKLQVKRAQQSPCRFVSP